MSDPVVHRTRVVVVDGDARYRHGLAQMLPMRGDVDVVATAISMRTALPKIEGHAPDVVVVDLVTDAVEGRELIDRLQASGQVVRVVGICATKHGEAAQRLLTQGIAVLARPEDADEDQLSSLAQEIQGLLGRGRTPQPPSPSPLPPAPMATVVAPAAPVAVTPPVATIPPVAAAPIAPVAAATPPAPAPKPLHERARPVLRVPAAPIADPTRRPRRGTTRIEAVGIGISTGGPKALAAMLPHLPADLGVPVLIVQHMPAHFTASLAESLARQCKLPVREARAGESVLPGHILIAPGGRHMKVQRTGEGIFVRTTEDPPENSCRPAVDYLFRSLGEVWGGATLAVMMTGMGEDGLAGCRVLHSLGAPILAQDEATSTVFGMPRGPIQEGLAESVSLGGIAARITEVVRGLR